jgi:hypothetical protein
LTVCTSQRIGPRGEQELFKEIYGDYPISFGDGTRANGVPATAVLTYRDLGTGEVRTLTLTGPVLSTGLPTT